MDPVPALPAERRGQGPRLVLAHGFTQNAGAWGPFADRLAQTHEVVAVDLPGHGRATATTADLAVAAEALGTTGGPASYLGYSLGGRVALHLALRRPELVERLVVIGAHPGIEDEAARAERRRADEALAARLEAEADLDAFLADWLAGPLFARLPVEAAALEARRRNQPAGLADSLRRCGTGTQPPLWERLPGLAMPVLAVAGAEDERFAPLMGRLAEAVGPNASVALVAGAGHACHLEQPHATAVVVEAFLARPLHRSAPATT